jgi:hypothetical protein
VGRKADQAAAKEPEDSSQLLGNDMGGDPSCWLHLFCQDCGVQLDGTEHLATCTMPTSDTQSTEP